MSVLSQNHRAVEHGTVDIARPTLGEVIEYRLANAPPLTGVVLIVGDHLEESSSQQFPSSLAFVISVGATDSGSALAGAGKVDSFGRARRWMAPTVPGFPMSLLLPAPLASG